MKKLMVLIFLACTINTFAQTTDKIVTLVVSGQGKTQEVGYLRNLNSANSELKRFLTLGIEQEYKLEAQKINKIIVKILENNSKQDFFMLDKNKKFLEFKEYYVFNTNMINKVKKTHKKERKMDKIKIPVVEI
jgi:hypothetical protein